MKKLFTLALIATGLLSMNAEAQGHSDKSKRKSPTVTVSQEIANGANVKISYSQPSLNGRVVGKDVEPMDGQLWRTGANEATLFEIDKDVKIDGKTVPAGKYSLFTIYKDQIVTIILNKKYDQWGTDSYSEENDQIRFKTKVTQSETPAQKLLFSISTKGTVSIEWGHKKADFYIQ